MQAYGLEHSNGGLITFGGGVPIKDSDGRFIGSIGVGLQRMHSVCSPVVRCPEVRWSRTSRWPGQQPRRWLPWAGDWLRGPASEPSWGALV